MRPRAVDLAVCDPTTLDNRLKHSSSMGQSVTEERKIYPCCITRSGRTITTFSDTSLTRRVRKPDTTSLLSRGQGPYAWKPIMVLSRINQKGLH